MVSLTILAILRKFRDIVLRKFQLRTKCVREKIITFSMSVLKIKITLVSVSVSRPMLCSAKSKNDFAGALTLVNAGYFFEEIVRWGGGGVANISPP